MLKAKRMRSMSVSGMKVFPFRLVSCCVLLAILNEKIVKISKIIMGSQNIWFSHPRKYGPGSRHWYVANNSLFLKFL